MSNEGIANKIGKIPPFPQSHPSQYAPRLDPEGVVFDPKIHLVNPLPIPPKIKILESDLNAGPGQLKLTTIRTSDTRRRHAEDLAYTQPFKVLTEEGVKALRQIISDSEKSMAISTPRNPKIIRGLGFTSKFVRDLNESPTLLNHLSSFANTPICAHPMVTNYSQINWGSPPKENEECAKPADVWHLDSVDYVLVIMLTDGFEGGELLVSDIDPNEAMRRIRNDDLPSELTTANKYGGPGYGIFMQGSKIAHAVSPLTGGGMRVTCVNSYASRNITRIDRPSIYNALSMNHTKQVYDPDYLRLISVRSMWKLQELIRNPSYDDPEKGEKMLDSVIEQLSLAKRLMKGDEKHDIPISEKVKLSQGGFQKYHNKRNIKGSL